METLRQWMAAIFAGLLGSGVIAWIWTGDWRWLVTGIVLAVVVFVVEFLLELGEL